MIKILFEKDLRGRPSFCPPLRNGLVVSAHWYQCNGLQLPGLFDDPAQFDLVEIPDPHCAQAQRVDRQEQVLYRCPEIVQVDLGPGNAADAALHVLPAFKGIRIDDEQCACACEHLGLRGDVLADSLYRFPVPDDHDTPGLSIASAGSIAKGLQSRAQCIDGYGFTREPADRTPAGSDL